MKKLILALFIIFFSSLLVQSQEKKVPYGNNPATGKYYELRGIKIYTEVYGTGEPLLVIHGNGGSIADFSLQIPYFEKNYKVILADNRAQGKTRDNGDSLTYEMMADDYDALLTAMGIDSANVIGWSDGGINSLLLAIRHPKKVKKMAFTGANLVPDSTAVYKDVAELVQPMYENAMKNKDKLSSKTSWKLMKLLVEQPNIPLTDLQTIQCPTLVIAGDHDVIRVEHTVQIFTNIPKANLWILPNSGHATPIAYKDEFNAVVDRFFKTTYREINSKARFY
ncbi:alpha/beta fold hydrolase [Pseudobacter ginsenosidimutans]|uniref:Pimeloyl-ACP methyl ester carboxylesterase n=1 Tax=Pseudobacter ginsenosidimutans TaxID=661488 RepID=A0A4Q7MYV5_9BACT|nr:alpha/beta hydrolase [Pseudobacter ginsenosidimutans]QEC40912.1 alpha/beta hydrolase [Pseudobacter ginsenosidimutans]RZS72350.1 pimeloyl-ACP methyl ester carboxylesterase [Pseudobacter ginsenosidimutans]